MCVATELNGFGEIYAKTKSIWKSSNAFLHFPNYSKELSKATAKKNEIGFHVNCVREYVCVCVGATIVAVRLTLSFMKHLQNRKLSSNYTRNSFLWQNKLENTHRNSFKSSLF